MQHKTNLMLAPSRIAEARQWPQNCTQAQCYAAWAVVPCRPVLFKLHSLSTTNSNKTGHGRFANNDQQAPRKQGSLVLEAGRRDTHAHGWKEKGAAAVSW